jgi:FtsZ-interacting cell division protein ZipA
MNAPQTITLVANIVVIVASVATIGVLMYGFWTLR